MASFSLRSQRTGLTKEFSLLEIIKLLGDKTNDQIWLQDNEDVFSISSFEELNNNGQPSATRQQWINESPQQIAGQKQFTLQARPYNNLLLIFWNGIQLKTPQDYQLNGQVVSLNYQMNGQDNLQFIYPT